MTPVSPAAGMHSKTDILQFWPNKIPEVLNFTFIFCRTKEHLVNKGCNKDVFNFLLTKQQFKLTLRAFQSDKLGNRLVEHLSFFIGLEPAY